MRRLNPVCGQLYLIAVMIFCGYAFAQEGVQAIDPHIFQEIRDHNDVSKNLEYLSDMIGPRLTGSPELLKAGAWAMDLSRRYGLENVHAELWQIAHAWRRGPAEARIISPVLRNLTIAAAGWSPSTPGKVRAKVIYVSASKADELHKYRGKLKGSVVIAQAPANFGSQAAAEPPSPIQEPSRVPDRRLRSPQAQFDSERMRFFQEEGVIAVLRDSDKSYGLLNMTDVRSRYEVGAIPVVMLTHEDYSLIWRLLQRGAVEMEIAIANSFSDGPVEVANTVAEIRGSEHPDEVVIICAHLDSWDLASGSTDDGAGVVAVLEAARAIKALGLRPHRTIRVVLFSGEEQGEIGSQEYVKQHQAELNKISAVLADDSSTVRILTIRLHQNYAARKTVDTVLAPMAELKLVEPWMMRAYGSDYASFNDVGVPAFSTVTDDSDYLRKHHSQADTFDKVQMDGVIHAAQVLAGWAYNTAQLPALVPRDAP